MPFLELENESFHYELSGSASSPVLIFSNSLGTDLALWDEQTRYLGQHFRVLRYDTRGHGLSIKSPGPYSVEQLGKDVLALADALNIDRFAFCGISMGGIIGQWLGLHAPERLRHLVLCNTAAKIGQPDAWFERAALVRSQGMEPVAATTASRWFTNDYISTHPAQVARWVDALRKTDSEGYAACCEALATADFREDLHRIKTPTLVLAGTLDPITTTTDADFIASAISGAQRADVPASHLSNLEAPTEFNAAISGFLSS